MPLIIRDTSAVPPERWHYPVEETGYDVYAPSYPVWLSMVNEHCRANGVRERTEQELIDYACANLSVPCYNGETKVPLINRFVMGMPAPAPSCCGSAKK